MAHTTLTAAEDSPNSAVESLLNNDFSDVQPSICRRHVTPQRNDALEAQSRRANVLLHVVFPTTILDDPENAPKSKVKYCCSLHQDTCINWWRLIHRTWRALTSLSRSRWSETQTSSSLGMSSSLIAQHDLGSEGEHGGP